MGVVELPVDLRSVRAARAFLRDTVAGPGAAARPAPSDDTVESAALMLSELVTNAVRHTRAVLVVSIDLDDVTLRVEVVDDAPGLPTLRARDQDATSGRGLQIVADLSDRWGCTPDGTRKTVWFEVSLP